VARVSSGFIAVQLAEAVRGLTTDAQERTVIVGLDASETEEMILLRAISGARFRALRESTAPRGAAAKNIVWYTDKKAQGACKLRIERQSGITFKVTLKVTLKVFARLRSADAGRIVRDGNPGLSRLPPGEPASRRSPPAASLLRRTCCKVRFRHKKDSALTASRPKVAE
jgi:hypothetical protein